MVAGLEAEQPKPWPEVPWAARAEVEAGVGAAARAAAAESDGRKTNCFA